MREDAAPADPGVRLMDDRNPRALASARVIAFVRLGRPQFLLGGFLLFGLGAAVARSCGAALALGPYALGQAGITVVQLMTHYANDYFDLAADRANATPTRFSGGSRVLPSGLLPAGAALVAARALGAAGVGLVIALALWGGPGGRTAAGLLLLAEVLAWAYSAPPAALHSRGLGELVTAVVVTGLTPLVGFVLQASGLPSSALGPALRQLGAAILPLAGLQFGMLLAIELPDAAGDAAVGKRTLVVRLGASRAAVLYGVSLVGVLVSIPLFALGALPLPLPPAAVLALALPAPLALWQLWRIGTGAWRSPEHFEGLALRAVALLVASSATELAAFISIASIARAH